MGKFYDYMSNWAIQRKHDEYLRGQRDVKLLKNLVTGYVWWLGLAAAISKMKF